MAEVGHLHEDVRVSVAMPSSVLGSSQLADAIADSVAAGLRELDDLQAMIAEAGEALATATERLVGSDRDERAEEHAEESNAFAVLIAGAASELQQRIAASREVVSTFNIVFFGRTGAGKSTLMSAMGRLDGGRVSPGDSDWTVKVDAIDWHGCRLYDTPGTGGWGGPTQSKRARRQSARGYGDRRRRDLVLRQPEPAASRVRQSRRLGAGVRKASHRCAQLPN